MAQERALVTVPRRPAAKINFASGCASQHHPMRPKQLRRLHALWRRWVGKRFLAPDQDRQLRHYFIWLFTQSQCSDTRTLTERQASRVIRWLARQVRQAKSSQDHVAGTAGRQGYPEQRQVPPNEAAWRALWDCAIALGMSRLDLKLFIRRQYARAGLQGSAGLRTMADLNRVLWGLKAMLRRQKQSRRFSNPGKHAA
jgi:hypothetical protein